MRSHRWRRAHVIATVRVVAVTLNLGLWDEQPFAVFTPLALPMAVVETGLGRVAVRLVAA